jgi:hypothetical protein
MRAWQRVETVGAPAEQQLETGERDLGLGLDPTTRSTRMPSATPAA